MGFAWWRFYPQHRPDFPTIYIYKYAACSSTDSAHFSSGRQFIYLIFSHYVPCIMLYFLVAACCCSWVGIYLQIKFNVSET